MLKHCVNGDFVLLINVPYYILYTQNNSYMLIKFKNEAVDGEN